MKNKFAENLVLNLLKECLLQMIKPVEKILAKYENGILILELPKKDEVKLAPKKFRYNN